MGDPGELYPWISAAAIAWGLLDCFFGYRVFKLTLGLFGALIGIWLAQAAAQYLGADADVATVAMIAAAVVGAALVFLIYLAAVFSAGFGLGSTLGVLLLAQYHPMVAALTGVVFGLIVGFLALQVQRVLIVLATALMGAFRVVLAACYFTGRLDWLFYLRQPAQLPALIENNFWMFPTILVLAAVGTIAQLETGNRKNREKEKPKD